MHGTLGPDFSTEACNFLLLGSFILGVLGGIFCARARLNVWLPIYAVSSGAFGLWRLNVACEEQKNLDSTAFIGSLLWVIFAVLVVGCVLVVAGVSWAIARWLTRKVIYLVLLRRGPARHRIP